MPHTSANGERPSRAAYGELPDLEQLQNEFAPRQAQCPDVAVDMPPPALYDTLLGEEVSV